MSPPASPPLSPPMSPSLRETRDNAVRGYGLERRPATVAALLQGSPFVGYAYAYPHKTAYRELPRPRPLAEVWAGEPTDALFLYLHVPFCALRCGFCNLFTQKHPPESLPAAWLTTLERQIEALRNAVPEARFTRWALGGGTPTLLAPALLERLFERLHTRLGVDLEATPSSVETSPETCDDARLDVLEAVGTHRVSIGIQSFDPGFLRAVGRPQANTLAERALDRIRARAFPILNIDLIYGIAGQTPADFVTDIEAALRWAPEQLYLYPLYQRPLTGLGKQARSWDDQRSACLGAGRQRLLAAGYVQVSMRMFQKPAARGQAESSSSPAYCCQADGMIGLGVGARSYTRNLHYADDWAVGAAGVRDIVSRWIDSSDEALASARYGIELGADEQRRRWLIQSLLQREGLDLAAYLRRFANTVDRDFELEIRELETHGLIALDPSGERLRPTPLGLEWADAIAPWLYSEAVRAASRDFELR